MSKSLKNHLRFVSPDKSQFIHFFMAVVPSLGIFLIVYFSMNWVGSQQTHYYQFYTEHELAIPFVPESIFIYLSCYLIPVLPLFFLNKHELKIVRNAFIGSILVAGICFYFFPAQLGFERNIDAITDYKALYHALFMIDLPHNLAPSLHVNVAGLFAFVLAFNRPLWFQLIMYAWVALIGLSILLTHQHHLFDLVTGLVLSYVFYRFYYLKKLSQLHSRAVSNLGSVTIANVKI